MPSGGLTCERLCAQHYHLRWEAHMNSQKLETQVRAKLQASIDKLETKQSTLKDYSWLSAVRAHAFVGQAFGRCDTLLPGVHRNCRRSTRAHEAGTT